MERNEALLVIDVQRVYMEPEPMVTSDGNDLILKCRTLIHEARERRVPVVFVQHVSESQPDDPDLVGIHPGLGRLDAEPVVQKRFGSAFFRTDLKEILAGVHADTLYVCGLATFGCVNATVMCALCKDFDVRVVRDAHGCLPLEEASATARIETFNELWERAGATLVRAKDVRF